MNPESLDWVLIIKDDRGSRNQIPDRRGSFEDQMAFALEDLIKTGYKYAVEQGAVMPDFAGYAEVTRAMLIASCCASDGDPRYGRAFRKRRREERDVGRRS